MPIALFSAKPFQTSRAEHQNDNTKHIIVNKYDELQGKKYVEVQSIENKDKKSTDYFDTKETIVSYKDDKHGNIEIHISGKGREENIKVIKNDEQIEFSSRVNEKILSMNGTFPHDEMHLLESLEVAGKSKCTEILPYIEINNNQNKYGASSSADDISKLVDFRLQNNKDTREIIIPVLSNKDHWFMVSFDIDKKNRVINPTITNTTNEAKANGDLTDVISGYKDVLEIAKNSFANSKEFATYTINNPNFCQSLQYGNMGCGITTSLNIQSLANGEICIDKLKFNASDFRSPDEALKISVLYKGEKYSLTGDKASYVQAFTEIHGNKIPESMITSDSYNMNDLQTDIEGAFYGTTDTVEVEITNESLSLLKNDKSQRSNLILEAIRRVDLAFDSSEREEKISSLHCDLRKHFYLV